MMNTVIYARYSSDKQTEQSIDGQLRICHEFADKQGLTVVHEYIDRAISGTTDKRPEFLQMISDSAQGGFKYVIVYKLDRFSRNRYDSAIYKRKLGDNGVKVLSAMENITDSPEGIIIEGLLEAMNEYYSAELSQKVKRGLRENIIKGKSIGGKIPFGFKSVDGYLAVDDTTAPVVQKIFQMYADGKTYTEIINWCNEQGIRTSTGGAWNKGSLHRMLVNKKYIGVVQVDTITEVAQCPRIISDDLFDAVQARLEAAPHRSRRSPYDYRLTGKARCRACGTLLCGTSGTGRSGKIYHYYKCKTCGMKIRADVLEDAVDGAVLDYLQGDTDAIAEAAYNAYMEQPNDHDAIEKQISEIDREINNIVQTITMYGGSQLLVDRLNSLQDARSAAVERRDAIRPKFTKEHFKLFLERLQGISGDPSKLYDACVSMVAVSPDTATVVLDVIQNKQQQEIIDLPAADSDIVSNGGASVTISETGCIMLSIRLSRSSS